jgi:alpha-1,3-rhamnosyl/mannosyltransferase
MRVVVNQTAALGLRTGIGHYTAQLVDRLFKLAGDDQVDAFPSHGLGRAQQTWSWLRRRVSRRPQVSTNHKGESLHGQTILGRYFRLRSRLRRCDLYHEPNFIPWPCDLPTVATLHDLSALLHPEWHPAGRIDHFERNFLQGLRQCCHFLAISEYGRQEIIRTLNIPPERVTRTYMGIRPGLVPLPRAQVGRVLQRLGLPRNYLLCLGTIEPRKNVLRLLRAYCALPGSLRGRWPLLLVGSWGWKSDDVADYLHREARHRNVIHLGYVRERHIGVLYNGARALVFPSLYEGFGMPPLEMMACGGAVLASTAGALRETLGRHVPLIEPEDSGGWHDALRRVLVDDGWWNQLREGVIEAAGPYTWEACAADTLGVYRRLCGTTPAPVEITDFRRDAA